MNRNRPTKRPELLPLSSIPNKEGFVLIGVRRGGGEALLTVFIASDGTHKVIGFDNLIGWRMV